MILFLHGFFRGPIRIAIAIIRIRDYTSRQSHHDRHHRAVLLNLKCRFEKLLLSWKLLLLRRGRRECKFNTIGILYRVLRAARAVKRCWRCARLLGRRSLHVRAVLPAVDAKGGGVGLIKKMSP